MKKQRELSSHYHYITYQCKARFRAFQKGQRPWQSSLQCRPFFRLIFESCKIRNVSVFSNKISLFHSMFRVTISH
jgi:hypothetical protein